MMQTLGFVGLGMMGLPMLENLAGDERWQILAYDRSPAPFERLAGHPPGANARARPPACRNWPPATR